MKSKKQFWIDAYQKTLDEYIANTHEADCNTCKKCISTVYLYAKTKPLFSLNVSRVCRLCPESIFSYTFSVPCTYRKCQPDNSVNLKRIEKKRVIEYHKRAINFLKSMNRFNMEKFKQQLLKIDENVYEIIK